jgi:hypothetical protein
MRRTAAVILVLVFALPAAASAHHRPARWIPVPTGSDQQYRGLDAVDCVPGTCLASGPAGAVVVLAR